jgi:glycosyltransferase involved in cell wall biosynthesis
MSTSSRRGKPSAPIRAVVVVSHPIQYYAPLYRALAASTDVDLLVLFAAKIGLEVRRDVLMGVDMAWNTDLTGGYAHRFLEGAERIQHTGLFEIDNPNVGAELARANPDVVLLHGYASLTSLKALAWARLHRRPVIMISDSTIDSSAQPLRRLLKRVLARAVLAQFSAFLTLGDRGEAYLARYGVPASRMFRCPAMIDSAFWQTRDDRKTRRAAKRRALGIGANEVVLIAAGKLYGGKRLLDVIAALKGVDAPVRLVVAGDGEQRAELESAARDAGVKADFLGFVNIDALPDLYAAGDILVHAAEVEQYGMVLLEAAVVGLPVIASDRIGAIGPTSIARPGVNALVYPCGDVAALRAAILALAGAPRQLAQFAQASLVVSEDHRGKSSVAAVAEACRQAIGRR